MTLALIVRQAWIFYSWESCASCTEEAKVGKDIEGASLADISTIASVPYIATRKVFHIRQQKYTATCGIADFPSLTVSQSENIEPLSSLLALTDYAKT